MKNLFRPHVFLAAFFIFSLAAPLPADTAAVDKLDADGIGLMAELKYGEALDKFNKSLELMPENGRALINRAICEQALGSLDLAIIDYKKVIAVAPEFKQVAEQGINNALLTKGRTMTVGPSSINPYRIEDTLDRTIQNGLHHLYNLEFDDAKKTFESIQNRADEHPMVAFCIATVHWWRISVDVSENDKNQSRPFLLAASRCIRAASYKIRSGDPTGEAHVALGSTYALLARWEGANRNWMSVYQREKKARAYLKKALKINPAAVDANMGLGIFEYALSTMPMVVRMLPGAHASGDPQVGIRKLQIAADHGAYLRLPAVFLLCSIYSEDLNDPEKTIAILSNLRREFPASPFVHVMMFTALYNGNCAADMKSEATDYEARVKDGVYRPEFASQAHFLTGLVHFKSREWPEAVKQFDRAAQSGAETSPFRVWATLYKGYALDAMAKREEALACYQTVAQQRARWKSVEFAKKRIDTPFKETDPELTTLLL